METKRAIINSSKDVNENVNMMRNKNGRQFKRYNATLKSGEATNI